MAYLRQTGKKTGRELRARHLLLSGVSALALGVAALPALAQTAPADDNSVETVVVTGIRASVQSAQSIKRNADQVVDSITAVDIGALPDRNVAEALQRVPGVTLQRNSSPNDLSRMGTIGSSVYVRGLSWVKTLINGRDEFTAASGRELSFADVPADLISAVNVYKTPTASQIEGGVGGTVDLVTRKPFDHEGLLFAASADYTYGDVSGKALPSANALVSDTWNTGIGEFGVLASVDWQDIANRTKGVNLNPYNCWNETATANIAAGSNTDSTAANYSQCAALTPGKTGALYGPNGFAWRQLEFTEQRLATNLVLQWRPSDQLEFTLSGLNSYALDTDMEHYVWSPVSNAQMLAAKFDKSYHWLGGSGTTTSIDTRGGTGHNRNTDIDFAVKYTPADNFVLTADAQFVESSSPYRNNTMYTGFMSGAPTINVDVASGTPKITWTDNSGGNLQDKKNYDWLADMDHLQDSIGHATTARVDGTYTFDQGGLFGFFKSASAGFRTEQKVYVARNTGYNWGATCPTGWGGDFANCPLLDGTVANSYTALAGNTVSQGSDAVTALNKYAQLFHYASIFGNSLPSFYLPSTTLALMNTVNSFKILSKVEPLQAQTDNGVGSWASWQPYAALAGCTGTDFTCIAAYQNVTKGGASSGNRMSNIDEETYAEYLQLDFGQDTFLGYDIPIEGNIGLRIVRTEDQVAAGMLVMPKLNQNSCTSVDCSGFDNAVQFLGAGNLASAIANQGATVPRPAVKNGYTNYLPSFNVAAHLSDDVIGRLAYSETLVRPDFSDMDSSASLNYSFFGTNTTQSGVFQNAPSGNGGNPDLKPMRARNYDASMEWYFAPTGSLTFAVFHKNLSDYIYTATQLMAFTHPLSGQTEDFEYTTYVNGSRGHVEGFELAYTQFYDQLPGWWGGFGLQTNYTKIYNSGGHNGPVDVTNAAAISNSNLTSLPMEGMSHDSYNVTLMYAKYGIDARLAWNWRSTYLSSSSDANTHLPVWVENYGQLDGSVFYNIMDHYKIGLELTNLTGENFRTDMGYADFHPQTNYIQTDRKYAIVLRTSW
jgi:TonB-dependent receptor